MSTHVPYTLGAQLMESLRIVRRGVPPMKTIMTHDGPFHADEIAAVAVLATIEPDATIKRTRNAASIQAAASDPDAILVDVGGGRYDHHQPGGNGQRENGIPYASFGLVWRDFGESFVKTILGNYPDYRIDADGVKEVVATLERQLVMPIDAHDVGYNLIAATTIPDVRPVTLQDIIRTYNPIDGAPADYDRAFNEAVTMMQGVLHRSVVSCVQSIVARATVEQAINQWSKRLDEPIVLDRFVPRWAERICQTEALFVAFPRQQGGWNAVAVPVSPQLRENRLLAPTEWRGLQAADLESVSGVSGAIFCHPNGFMFACETLEGICAMVARAVAVSQHSADPETRESSRASRSH
jgi:uncharacterized UPF0160 family protein